MFFETSAKIAINVEEAFLSTAKLILENIEKDEYDLTNEVSSLDLNIDDIAFAIQSIGIKPGNALPMYAASGADKKRKQAAAGKSLSNQKVGGDSRSSSCCS